MSAYNGIVNVKSSCFAAAGQPVLRRRPAASHWLHCHSRSSEGQRKEREQYITTDMLTTGQTRVADGGLDT